MISNNLEETHKIQLLPEHIVDQIKAGEVIERPSFLLKELLENSIDAESTKIQIHIVENGLEKILVKDNGQGIDFHDLPYAFCRHATSKISRFEDLFTLSSFGFRGEALASIASISKVKCTSSTSRQDFTGQIVYEGGKLTLHNQSPKKQVGTSIVVQELFYNTPVRFKFIKSKTSERNSILRIIQSFILGHPQVEFEVKWDDKDKEVWRKSTTTDRLKKVWRTQKTEELQTLKDSYEDHQITLYLGPNKKRMGQNFILINGRVIEDKSIHNQIIHNSVFKGLESKTKLSYLLDIRAPEENIDVNVHPNKIRVKFEKSTIITALISKVFKSIQMEIPTPTRTKEIQAPNNIPIAATPLKRHHDLLSRFLEKSSEQEETVPTVMKSQLFSLSKRFWIFSTGEEQKYLVDTQRAIFEYCLYHFKANQILQDQQIIPLLVSDPLKIDFKNISLMKLKEFGIEIDQLDEQTSILRSIPFYWNHLPYELILTSFIEFHKKHSNLSLKESFIAFYQENLEETMKVSPTILEEILKSDIHLSDKSIRTINDQSLEKYFS